MKTRLFTRRAGDRRDESTRAPREVRRGKRAEPRGRARDPRTRAVARQEAIPSVRARSGDDGSDLRWRSGRLIHAILAFRSKSAPERPRYSQLREEIEGELRKFDRDCAEGDRDGHARFALIALADEIALTTEWEGARSWKEDPLQVREYGKFDAGDRFFARLDEVMEEGDTDVLEVFYHCLCAGFRGSLNSEPERLRSLRKRILPRLPMLDLRDEPCLSPDAYDRHIERPLIARRFPVAWALPFVLGAIGLYAAYYVTLGGQVEDIRSEVVANRPLD